jgi:hypothetical protein
MNRLCMECDAPNGSRVLHNADGEWLMLGDDCCYYTPQGQRLRMSELPEAFEDSKVVKVKLRIIMGKYSPRCLCQVCASKKGRERAATPKVKQLSFYDLVET